MEPDKVEENWRNADGTWKEGHPGTGGRPKGQSLKEFWRQRFAEMSEEERIEFTKKVGNDVIWKMAEGNPANATDLTSKGQQILVMPPELIQKNDTNPKPVDNSDRPPQV
jgi:hypothetical protein